MPKILYQQHHISKMEVEENQKLIEEVLSGRLRSPQVKKLAGVTYNKEGLFRVKIDKKHRLIFTYVPHEGERTLLVLAVNNHNYKQLKRQFSGPTSPVEDLKALSFETPEKALSAEEPPVLNFVATTAVTYKQMTLVLDNNQQEALQYSLPLLLSGPPGAGKTAILYNLMLTELEKLLSKQKDNTQPVLQRPILFISQSTHLLNQLRDDYSARFDCNKAPIIFSTWQGLYPADTQFVNEQDFALWITDYFSEELPRVVHYEMSLLAALSSKDYQNLGRRQSYFSGNAAKQQLLEKAQVLWLSYLQKQNLIDPMIMPPCESREYSSIYCDEAQNQAPVALKYLINHVSNRQFVACLDSEQCLVTSPFIQNCLKQLLYAHYKQFNEYLLPRTWRCSQTVTQVLNYLMQMKYTLDGGDYRREYREIRPVQSTMGQVSWISASAFSRLKAYGTLASTVVIADKVSAEDRAIINSELGTNNILTVREAIGLDFTVSILWKPISQKTSLRRLSHKAPLSEGLTLEQWHGFNALYVSLSRAERDVYLFEPDDHLRETVGNFLLGTLPLNAIQILNDQVDATLQTIQWQDRVTQYLAMGLKDKAVEIMRFHLHLPEEEIEKKVKHYCLTLDPRTPSNRILMTETRKKTIKEQSLPDKKIELKKLTPIQTEPANAPSIKGQNTPGNNNSSELLPAKTTSKVADDKCKKYINELLKNVTESNLTKLLENKNAAHLLLGYPLNNRMHLFHTLFTEERWRKKMITVLLNCKLVLLSKLFTANFLCDETEGTLSPSVLYILSSFEDTQLILTKLLHVKPSLINEINATTLCRAIPYPGRSDGLTPLDYLAMFPEGITILNQLLSKNHELARGITAKALCRSLPEETGVLSNLCVLSDLCNSVEGQTILSLLLTHNHDLAKGITAEILCRPFDGNQSLLYLFALIIDGLQVLNQLLAQNPDLIKGITAEALCRAIPKTAGKDANKSALSLLCCDDEGRKLLRQLLRENPDLSRGITAEALCRAISKDADIDANKSPLFFLASKKEGLKILSQLLTENPALARGISAEALCRAISKDADIDAYKSPLFFLASTNEGRKILNQILTENPDLVGGITAEAICRSSPQKAGKAANESPLYFLSSNDEGIDILTQLLKNPEFANGITAEALCLARPLEAGENGHVSPLLDLAYTSAGLSLLNQLLQNPTLAKGITAEALCRELPKDAGLYAYDCPLYVFVMSYDGLDTLNLLLEKNPDLVKAITAKTLCRVKPKEAGPEENKSILFYLSNTLSGRRTLNRLITQNPNLAKGISVEALCQALPATANIKANQSALYFITSCPEGIRILNQILDQNPELVKGITAEVLCRARPNESGMYANLSALSNLSSSREGQATLSKLLMRNLNLAQGITAEALCRFRPKEAGKNENQSSLFFLTGYPEGRRILSYLVEQNPDLARGITVEDLCRSTTIAGVTFNQSPLYFLAMTSDGLNILNNLIEKNSNLAKGITGEFLCKALTKEVGISANHSILYHLSCTPDGIVLFSNLLNKNPSIAMGISAEALQLECTDSNTENKKSSVLLELQKSDDGQKILKKISDYNPSIKHLIEKVPANHLEDLGLFASKEMSPVKLKTIYKTQNYLKPQ